jgi:NAD(P)-dependent dehydrogenase (short-subunit alcohol dehydrogenase family)
MVKVLDLFKLDGKVALVTGGGSGLGEAFAEAMVEAGAAVVVADINLESATQVAKRLSQENPGSQVISLAVDVSDETQVREMVDTTVARLGRLDIVFANAGIAPYTPAVPKTPLEIWNQTLAINLTGVFLTAREAARVMIQQGQGGKIINTASVYGQVGSFSPNHAYTAAKGGVVNLTRDLAVALAPHKINVSAIAPAFVRTNLAGGFLKSDAAQAKPFLDEIIRRTPLGRLAEASEFKGIALYLASAASDYLTGETVAVDGGWLAL